MIIFNIKKIRESKNLSIYRLNKLTGISRTYLRELENNKKQNPTLEILLKISRALDVNIKDLFYSIADFEEIRNELHSRIEKYGLNARETIEISNILDFFLLH